MFAFVSCDMLHRYNVISTFALQDDMAEMNFRVGIPQSFGKWRKIKN